jgi:hypothetical protein
MTGKGTRIAEWSERPYTDYKRRQAVVYHRVMLFAYDHGVDVEHQIKGDSDAPIASEWKPLDVYEVRNGYVQKLNRGEVLRE